MRIQVDSIEYKCWHEVGHATVCLHLGGNVESIEFLEEHARGYARTRCVVFPEIEKAVACGGFAAEFYLLKMGYAEKRPDDDRDISQIVFHNATADQEDFRGRRLGADEAFSEAEAREFMAHAISLAASILHGYYPRMKETVRELFQARKIEGRRLKDLLHIGISR